MIFGALAPSLFTSMAPWMAAAIGSGLGSMIQGGSTEDVLKSAAMGGLGAGIGTGFSGGSTAIGGVNPANANSLAGIGGEAGVGTAINPFKVPSANAGMDFGGINATKFGSGSIANAYSPSTSRRNV